MDAYAPLRKPEARPAESFPFVSWIGALMAQNIVARQKGQENEDFILDDTATKQFCVGAEPGGVVVLGIHSDDVAALTSIPWKSAALVRGHRNRDWVALAARDARVKNSLEMNIVPVRLWIPVTSLVMDAFAVAKFNQLVLREAVAKDGVPTVTAKPPLTTLPLAQKGRWAA